jgi:hypothetical protein
VKERAEWGNNFLDETNKCRKCAAFSLYRNFLHTKRIGTNVFTHEYAAYFA